MTRIVAFHDSHNSSVCEIKNQEIIYVQEAERLDGVKRSSNIEILVEKYKNQHIEKIIFAMNKVNEVSKLNLLKYFLKKNNVTYDVLNNYHEHHFFHACSAYYKSGFDESYVLVSDGGGKIKEVN
jgi:predicted NodU family carbamoyl transferase